MINLNKDRRELFISIGIIFISLIIFFSPVLFTSKMPVPFLEQLHEVYPFLNNNNITNTTMRKDIRSEILASLPWEIPWWHLLQFIPWFHFEKQCIHNLELPLWNPYQGCGSPFIANMQSAFFYPLNIFVYLFSWKWGLTLLYFFKLFFIGLFAYLYLKELFLSWQVSIIGSIAWMFSSYNLFLLYFPQTNISFYLPFGLFITELILKKPLDLKLYLYLSIGIAVALFGGHPEVFFYTSILLGCYFLYRVLMKFGLNKHSLLILVKGFVFTLIGLGIASIQLLPFLEYLFYSSAESVRANNKEIFNSFQSLIIVLTILPDYIRFYLSNFELFNILTQLNLPPFSLVTQMNISILLLSIVGFYKFYKNEIILFFLIMLVFGIFSIFKIPLIHGLITSLPGFSLGGASFYMFAITCFGIIPISSIVLDKFIKNQIDFKIIKMCAYILAFVIFIISLIFIKNLFFIETFNANFIRDEVIDTIIAIFIITLTVCILKIKGRKIILLLLGTLIYIQAILPWIGGNFVSSSKNFYPKIKVFDYFLMKGKQPFRVATVRESDFEAYHADINTFYQVESIDSFDALGVRWYDELAASLPLLRLFNLTNTKYVISNLDLSKYGFENIPSLNSNITFKNPYAFKRAFMVYNYIIILQDNREALRTLNLYSSELDNLAIIFQHDSQFIPFRPSNSFIKADNNIEFLSYKPNYLKIKVFSSEDGLLVISNTYFPGWHAFVDGKKQKIIRTDYAFQGVFIKHGTHIIIIRYLPFSFILGSIISLISSVIVLLFFVYTKKRDANLS